MEFNLAVWQIDAPTTKLKSAKFNSCQYFRLYGSIKLSHHTYIESILRVFTFCYGGNGVFLATLFCQGKNLPVASVSENFKHNLSMYFGSQNVCACREKGGPIYWWVSHSPNVKCCS